MNYTCLETGAIYTQSYWIAASLYIRKPDGTGNIVFYGYADHQARLDGKREIATKSYKLTPDSYEEYFAPSAQNPSGVNPYATAYQMALETLEGQAPEEGEPDSRISFFEGAEPV